jgi:hypothetical protein
MAWASVLQRQLRPQSYCDAHSLAEEENLLAKREIIKETNIVDEAFQRLNEARTYFARTVIAADVEAEEGPRSCDEHGLLCVMLTAEEAFIDAYFEHLDALEKEDKAAAAAKPAEGAKSIG